MQRQQYSSSPSPHQNFHSNHITSSSTKMCDTFPKKSAHKINIYSKQYNVQQQNNKQPNINQQPNIINQIANRQGSNVKNKIIMDDTVQLGGYVLGNVQKMHSGNQNNKHFSNINHVIRSDGKMISVAEYNVTSYNHQKAEKALLHQGNEILQHHQISNQKIHQMSVQKIHQQMSVQQKVHHANHNIALLRKHSQPLSHNHHSSNLQQPQPSSKSISQTHSNPPATSLLDLSTLSNIESQEQTSILLQNIKFQPQQQFADQPPSNHMQLNHFQNMTSFMKEQIYLAMQVYEQKMKITLQTHSKNITELHHLLKRNQEELTKKTIIIENLQNHIHNKSKKQYNQKKGESMKQYQLVRENTNKISNEEITGKQKYLLQKIVDLQSKITLLTEHLYANEQSKKIQIQMQNLENGIINSFFHKISLLKQQFLLFSNKNENKISTLQKQMQKIKQSAILLMKRQSNINNIHLDGKILSKMTEFKLNYVEIKNQIENIKAKQFVYQNCTVQNISLILKKVTKEVESLELKLNQKKKSILSSSRKSQENYYLKSISNSSFNNKLDQFSLEDSGFENNLNLVEFGDDQFFYPAERSHKKDNFYKENDEEYEHFAEDCSDDQNFDSRMPNRQKYLESSNRSGYKKQNYKQELNKISEFIPKWMESASKTKQPSLIGSKEVIVTTLQ